jgi:ankyrin repeat protein
MSKATRRRPHYILQLFMGIPRMVQALLKYKADVNARSEGQSTPLHFASRGVFGLSISTLSSSSVARLLLEHGADISARGDKGFTPLHVAVHHGKVEVIHVLLKRGADIGAEGGADESALQMVMGEDRPVRLSGTFSWPPGAHLQMNSSLEAQP